jgi:hypothetical protein
MKAYEMATYHRAIRKQRAQDKEREIVARAASQRRNQERDSKEQQEEDAQ